jgi:hypothetical protein
MLVTLVVASGALAGCGGDDGQDDAAPPKEARQAVVGFLAAVERGDTAAACSALDADLYPDVRSNALGALTVEAGTAAERLRQVKAARRRASTCDGTMRLLAEETAGELDRVAARARTLPMTWLEPAGHRATVSVGDQDWVVQRHDGRWQLISANALPG